jgi:hypothetical protein
MSSVRAKAQYTPQNARTKAVSAEAHNTPSGSLLFSHIVRTHSKATAAKITHRRQRLDSADQKAASHSRAHATSMMIGHVAMNTNEEKSQFFLTTSKLNPNINTNMQTRPSGFARRRIHSTSDGVIGSFGTYDSLRVAKLLPAPSILRHQQFAHILPGESRHRC